MSPELLKAWGEMIGFEAGEMEEAHPRLVASVSKEEYEKMLSAWKLGEAVPKPLQIMKARALYVGAVAVCKPAPAPKVAEETAGPTQQELCSALVAISKGSFGGSAKEPPAANVVKMSTLIDPSNEATVPTATTDQVMKWFTNYKDIKYGDPLEDKEPTPDQISAMHSRIVVLKQEPYADFSLLTPHGRRMAKCLRHRSWIPQEDGTYKPVEVPGPDSFETWEACFRVYEVILLMLRWEGEAASAQEALVVTPIALEAYYTNFQTLAKEHPECWHLCQRAEDRCRAELFPRLMRKLAAASGADTPNRRNY